jgi:hypothetical protein
MAEHHRNLTIEDVRIDGSVGRILGIGLFGAPAAPSTASSIKLRGISSKHPLRWWPTGTVAAEGGAGARPQPETKTVPGDNFLIAESPSSIDGVVLEGIVIGGEHITQHSDWSLNVSGRVTNVAYRPGNGDRDGKTDDEAKPGSDRSAAAASTVAS